MTYNEARDIIIENVTRVGTNRISGDEVREAILIVLDFAAAVDNQDIIPLWTDALTFQTDGSDAGRYCKHADDNGKVRLFETKIDDNIDNEPPVDPLVTENGSWLEISASSGAVFPEWSPGLYNAGLIFVYHDHSTLGRSFVMLIEPVRPFSSTDIEAEITAGKWRVITSEIIDGGTP